MNEILEVASSIVILMSSLWAIGVIAFLVLGMALVMTGGKEHRCLWQWLKTAQIDTLSFLGTAVKEPLWTLMAGMNPYLS